MRVWVGVLVGRDVAEGIGVLVLVGVRVGVEVNMAAVWVRARRAVAEALAAGVVA